MTQLITVNSYTMLTSIITTATATQFTMALLFSFAGRGPRVGEVCLVLCFSHASFKAAR